MTIFDYLVLFVVICSILISMLRGLIKEILSLASWVIALFVANMYGESLAALLPEMIPGAMTRLIVAFIALFIGVRFLMMLLSMVLQGLIQASGLSVADRGLGGLFGLAKGMGLVIAVVLVCGTTAIPQQLFWRHAMFSPIAESAAMTALPFLPSAFAQHVKF